MDLHEELQQIKLEADRQANRQLERAQGSHLSEIEDDDDNSDWDWEGVSDKVDEDLSPNPLPVRPLGLSRRTGFSSYDDFDVITVHGARDDPQTAWTSPDDNSDWILDNLFKGELVRQLDFVYDTSDNARIYDPNADGIAVEADALLYSLTTDRIHLPETELDRPIIWICHDLGGSIVKQALVNATYKLPEIPPEDIEDDEYTMDFRRIYRRLPLLTSTIIFLGCPHNAKADEDLVDQLFAMMFLPGPLFRTQALKKIRNIAHQIERGNLDFLESKVSDRALIINIISGINQHKAPSTAWQPQKGPCLVEEGMTKDQEASHPFSSYKGQMLPNLGMFYTMRVETIDHLELVRGAWPAQVDKEGFDWVKSLSSRLYTYGHTVNIWSPFLAFQNSLLSVSPPTQVITQTHQMYIEDTSNPGVPALVKWIMSHSFFEMNSKTNSTPQTLYIYTGNKAHFDIKHVSKQLCVTYDILRKKVPGDPIRGCFYFEFDRHDSRRSGMKAMITYFICHFVCRFWKEDWIVVRMCQRYMSRHQSWTWMDLKNLFTMVLERCGNIGMTLVLAQFDHLEDFEGTELFKAIDRVQRLKERPFSCIMTATRPLDLICETVGPQNVINLDDGPLSPIQVIPENLVPAENTTQRPTQMPTIIRRPKSAQFAPKLNRMLKKFGRSSTLQEKVLHGSLNAEAEAEATSHRATGSVEEPPPRSHQKRLRGHLDQLTEPTQKLMRRVHSWVKHAAEPLTPEMLTAAMRSLFPQEMQQLGMNQSPQSFIKFVQETMGGIIVLQGRDLRFSNDAFYDVSISGMFQVDDKQTNRSHADMATVCLQYLLGAEGQEMLRSLSVENHGLDDRDLNWSPLMLPRNSLCSYALRFWTVHYRAAGSYRPIELALELLQDERKLRVWAEAVYVISNPFNRIQREYISPLPYMAMYGLDDLVRGHIENEEKHSGLNQDHWLAIAEAARNEHKTTVMLLVKHADMNFAGLAEAIQWAASSDYPGADEAALKFLIDETQRVESFCWPPYILNRAVANSHLELLSTLLQAGYDPNEKDSDDSCFTNAVHTAIMLDQQVGLEVLLNSGHVDLGFRADYYGRGESSLETYSTLAGAFTIGSRHTMEMLQDAGATTFDYDDIYNAFIDAMKAGNHQALAAFLEPLPQEFLDHGLIVASSAGFPQCVRLLLDIGANPNFVSEDGKNALANSIWAGEAAYLEVCRMLLDKDADPNQRIADNFGRPGVLEMCCEPPTVLMVAIASRETTLVSMLLDHGAAINGLSSPAGRDLPLTVAVVSGRMEVVDLLLKRKADPNLGYVGGEPGASPPLLVACHFKPEPTLIQSLIDNGAKVGGTMATAWASALHVAAKSDKSLPLLPLLLAHGAEINAIDDDNYTPLMMAASSGCTKFTELLLKQNDPKPDLEVTSRDGRRALYLAVVLGYSEIVKLLLEAGADVDCQTPWGEFPLGELLASEHYQQDREDLLELMLQRKPNLRLADRQGNTVLHNIKSETPLSVVVRLVVEGAPVNTFNDLGYTPLACAVHCGNTDVARYMTTVRGVETDANHPSFGSILHLAAEHSTLDVVRQLIRTGAEHSAVDPAFGGSILTPAVANKDKKELRRIIPYLVEEVGVDVEASGGPWISPVFRTVAESKGSQLLKYLLNHGARTDHASATGRTAVHWAVLNRRLIDLETLVEFGADIVAVDAVGRSALHYAAAKADLTIVRYILEKAPDGAAHADAADMDGWTPLMWAVRSGSSIAFALIDEYQVDTYPRSYDSEWSPLRIARLCGWDEEDIDGLKWRIEAQGREESYCDDEQKPGSRRRHICDMCFMELIGELWCCMDCDSHFCFKCMKQRAKIHDPDHDLHLIRGFEEERDIDELIDELEHEREGGSETGSGDGEREEFGSEVETESEEEDDEDDSDSD